MAGNPRELRGLPGLILDCQCYVGGARLHCTETFFPLSAPSLLKLSPFQALIHLRGDLKTAGGKESFSSSYKDFLAGELPGVN
jgi:hypothetical protein